MSKTDTTQKTGATAGDRLIEAIFGDRVGDGLSDVERAMNARRAVWAAEDAAKAADRSRSDNRLIVTRGALGASLPNGWLHENPSHTQKL